MATVKKVSAIKNTKHLLGIQLSVQEAKSILKEAKPLLI